MTRESHDMDNYPDALADNSHACNEADDRNERERAMESAPEPDELDKALDRITAHAVKLAEDKYALRTCLINVNTMLAIEALNHSRASRRASDEVLRVLEETR